MTFRLHIEHTALAELVEFATASDGPWPECAALAYLSIRQDRALTKGRDHEPFPSLRELTATFRWVTRNGTPALGRVRKLLQAEERWGFTDERRVSEWRKLMGRRCRGASKTASLHAGCTPDARDANAEETPATDEAPEPASETNAEDTGRAQPEHTSIYTRVRSNPPILQSSNKQQSAADASSDAQQDGLLRLTQKPKPDAPSATDEERAAVKAAAAYWGWSTLQPGDTPNGKTPGARWTWKHGMGAKILADIRKRGADVTVARFRWLALAAEPAATSEEWLRRASMLRKRGDAKTLLWDANADTYDGFRAAWEAAGCPSRMPDPLASESDAGAPTDALAAWQHMLSQPHVSPPCASFQQWVARTPAEYADRRKIKLAPDMAEHGRRYRALLGSGAMGRRWEHDHADPAKASAIKNDFCARYAALGGSE